MEDCKEIIRKLCMYLSGVPLTIVVHVFITNLGNIQWAAYHTVFQLECCAYCLPVFSLSVSVEFSLNFKRRSYHSVITYLPHFKNKILKKT